MGERISIQFVDESGFESAVLNSHWDGPDLVAEAVDFVEELKIEYKLSIQYPLARVEAGTVMADFVRHLAGQGRIESNYCLVTDHLWNITDHGFWQIKISSSEETTCEQVVVPVHEYDDDDE